MKMKPILFTLAVLAFTITGCSSSSPELTQATETLQVGNAAVPNAAPTPERERESPPVENISFAELLRRIGEMPDDTPTFPCSLDITLNITQKDGLQKVRRHWLRIEDDSRYELAAMVDGDTLEPSGWTRSCVCPGICVVVLQDKQTSPPNNYSVLVLNYDSPKRGHKWVAKGIDLSNARLNWSSSTPHFDFYGPNKEPIMVSENMPLSCWVRWNKQLKRYICASTEAEPPELIDYFANSGE